MGAVAPREVALEAQDLPTDLLSAAVAEARGVPLDSSTWPRGSAASPVASPKRRGFSDPHAPPEQPQPIAEGRSTAAAGVEPKPPRRARQRAADGQGEGIAEAKARSGSENRQRKHVARIRLDDAELAKLEERSRAAGLTVGAYLRACALETAGVRAKPRATIDREVLARVNADLNRVGNNVNQIAHALNIGLDSPHSVAAAMADLRGVLAVIRRAAGYPERSAERADVLQR